jgi:NodT family efflux transporter outer membrane factor (OMF) lipoprotein
MRKRPLLAAAASLLLASCAGSLARPHVQAMNAQSLGLAGHPAAPISAEWWHGLGDAQLDRIMADALGGNTSLATALARVREAQAVLHTRRADDRPQVTLDGQEVRNRLSEKYIIPPPYGGSTQWVGDVSANLTWTLDFWGKQAAAIRQASASRDAAALDADAARLALTGSVAQAYVEFARADHVIEVAQTSVAERQKSLRLVRVRIRSQLASDIDAKAAETELAQAEQALVRARSDRALALHALAALAGQGAERYANLGTPTIRLDAMVAVPGELPADLLSRRPDIAAALARIEAARQGRAVARKAFYPNINLIGLLGVQALGLGELFGTSAATYGAGAAVHLPIFDGGRLRSEHERATAVLDVAVADYNDHVVRAVRETADAITRVAAAGDDLASQRKIVSGLSESRRLDDVRVRSGLNSRLDIIEPELRLLDAKIGLANLEAQAATNRIQLLVALGGDFTPPAAPAAPDNS